ncbi:hypothetical protein ACTXKZ_10400 [Brachybacterium alimentarium]|uniref:hypothetical protein n=1 Tax=Brachybacterium alimentarium TaxID=47845 RepID=UPI003FD44364
MREAQGLWPELAPFFDRKALDGARRLGLPEDPETLDALIDPADRARLAAALVRAALRKVRPADLTGEDRADRPNGPSGS